MLVLIACLIGQFTPSEAKSPTFEGFQAVCQELKREQIAFQRALLELMKPAVNPVPKLSRTAKRQISEEIKTKEAELKRIEKDEKLLPAPPIIVQAMRVDQIGELFSRINYTDTSTANAQGKKVGIDKVEVGPAKLVVLKTFKPKVIVCGCDGIEFVLLHYKGQPPPSGETIEPQGIYRVSGQYTVAGKAFLAIEQWDRNTEWQKKIKRPEPTGRIEVVTEPMNPPVPK